MLTVRRTALCIGAIVMLIPLIQVTTSLGTGMLDDAAASRFLLATLKPRFDAAAAATGGTMCDLTTWTGTACPADTSTWYGIGCGPCSGEGFTVTSIALDGCFPDAAGPVVELEPNLGALTTLTRLQFSGSNVGGPLPAAWSTLRGLQELRLSSNELSGELPTAWSGLTALTALYLHSNQGISGTLPTQYAELGSSLREVSLDSTDLCGCFPPGWEAIRSLVPNVLPACTSTQPPPSPDPPSPEPPSLNTPSPEPPSPEPSNPPPIPQPSKPPPPSQDPPSRDLPSPLAPPPPPSPEPPSPAPPPPPTPGPPRPPAPPLPHNPYDSPNDLNPPCLPSNGSPDLPAPGHPGPASPGLPIPPPSIPSNPAQPLIPVYHPSGGPVPLPRPPPNCYTELEVVSDYEVIYSCSFCAGSSSDAPFSTFTPQLLDAYGELQYISLLFDDVIPAAVLAVRSVYGSGNSSTRVVTEGGSAFADDSLTVVEGQLSVAGAPAGDRTSGPGAAYHRQLSVISVCCGADGAVSQVTFGFTDGTQSSVGTCPYDATSRGASPQQQPDGGAEGVGASGGTIAVPAGGGFRLSGVRGDRGAAVGSLSFAFARKLNRPSPPPAPPAPPSPPLPPSPLLPPHPPSPPPPSPAPPPPPPSTTPQQPPFPPSPPSPTTDLIAAIFNESVQFDLPIIAQGLPIPARVSNQFPAATLVLLGPSIPIAVNDAKEIILGTVRYFAGRGIAFGGDKWVTGCCRPRPSAEARRLGYRKSDPGFDTVVRNLVEWAAGTPGSGSGRNGSTVLRVADRAYLRMAKFVSNQLPNLLERYLRRANQQLFLPLGDFVQSEGAGVDIYVVGPYDTYDARAVRVLLDFAASGKSLIFAGPDVMRRELYSTPDSVQPIAADGAGEATRPSAFRPMAGRASGATSSDAVLPGDKGGSSSPQLTRSRGRQLLQATKPVFNASSIPVNEVSGPMGMFFSGLVSNPGSVLTVDIPVELQNAELAAQAYLQYLRDARTLSPQELGIVTSSIARARATTTRNTPGAGRFWALLDMADQLAATRPALPPVGLAPPPPPLVLTQPARAPAVYTAPLPDGVSYVGCFPLPDPPALTTVLPADRANSLQRCLAAARNLSASTSQRLAFVALQRAACLCAPSLPPALVRAKAQDTACYLPCPGAQEQRCGGPSNGTQPLATLFRVLDVGDSTGGGGGGGPGRRPSRRPRAQGGG